MDSNQTIEYWKDLTRELSIKMENNAIERFTFIKIAKEIISNYSNHRENCSKDINCSCGFLELVSKFNKLSL